MKTFYIPGLGADIRLFKEMLPHLPGEQVAWPQYLGKDLKELARRVIECNSVENGDLVIGFSFGGQLAMEIKKLRPKVKAVTISSVRSSKELTLSFKCYARLVQILPNRLLKKLLLKFGISHSSKESKGLKQEHFELLKSMAYDLDMDFFKRTLWLCAAWKSSRVEEVFQINAENDVVIPFDIQSVNYIVPDAGHLITFSHPQLLCERVKQYANS